MRINCRNRRPTFMDSDEHDRLQSISLVAWHSVVTYEINPSTTTFLLILDLPESERSISGGDTLFLSQVQAYSSLNPQFQQFLEGWEAVHSRYEQAADARAAGGHVRGELVANVYLVVRVHQVTSEKALFVNK